ncbi:hypothetical protein BDK51DRAFT_29621 [Blyttiomyces helicus]|uniref:Uncharacterized protein n=1 Tax=Blyttiomyces helicus TaxID=388810 RepID=A0A4P9WQG3_9FUNG|nr:hypothetical protein BDK51DRAFT_29621 [Blyttiomyces helicus]|eukprot:RKO94625.1 hypothetical protein BDK51DRAFT_29621 [Blyttiomyces helicus]
MTGIIWAITKNHGRANRRFPPERLATASETAEFMLTECPSLTDQEIQEGLVFEKEFIRAIEQWKQSHPQTEIIHMSKGDKVYKNPVLYFRQVGDDCKPFISKLYSTCSKSKSEDSPAQSLILLTSNVLVSDVIGVYNWHSWAPKRCDTSINSKEIKRRFKEFFLEWRTMQTLSPIRYQDLPFFDQEQIVNQEHLRKAFSHSFQDVSRVLYLDSEAKSDLVWRPTFCSLPPLSHWNRLEWRNSKYSSICGIFGRTKEFPSTPKGSLIHRLISIRGKVSVRAPPLAEDKHPIYQDLYVCELDAPGNLRPVVCCMIDLRTRDPKTRLAQSQHCWFGADCLVFQMHFLDNIGDFFVYEPLVSKRDSSPLYRDTDIFDPVHVHWQRALLQRKEE